MPWGPKYIDEIEFFGIPDVGARVNALLAGDVHFVGNVNPASAKQILTTKVNGKAQQGLIRFASSSVAPNAIGHDPALPEPTRKGSSAQRGVGGFDLQDLAIFLFVGVPIAGAVLTAIFGRTWITAATRSPQRSSGTPTTTASKTASWAFNAASTSSG